MSESYNSTVPTNSATANEDGSLETAKHEAREVKDTAVTKGGEVASTAKDEAENVAREAKYQAKDLFHQTQRELKDQAQTQQTRAASGLRAVSEELDAMTSSAQNPGFAADLLGQASTRLSSAAGWLDARDPAALFQEVKSFARRRPGVFILGAAVLGVVAGRLTRALASNASDDHSAHQGTTGPTYGTQSAGTYGAPAQVAPPASSAGVYSAPPAVEDTPVYAQSSAARGTDDLAGEEGDDVRRDAF